jgi:hypothetical protein
MSQTSTGQTDGSRSAFHMAYVLMDMIDNQLCQNPAVQMNPEWQNFADIAHDNVMALYQSIGRAYPDYTHPKRAVDYYQNDFFEERTCDHCSKAYRGPAIYCSRPCAEADG